MNTEVQESTLWIKDKVTMSTLTKRDYDHFYACLQAKEIHTINLSRITEADSACIALLVEATRLTNHRASKLKMIHIPEGLIMLMKLYGIEEWIQ